MVGRNQHHNRHGQLAGALLVLHIAVARDQHIKLTGRSGQRFAVDQAAPAHALHRAHKVAGQCKTKAFSVSTRQTECACTTACLASCNTPCANSRGTDGNSSKNSANVLLVSMCSKKIHIGTNRNWCVCAAVATVQQIHAPHLCASA